MKKKTSNYFLARINIQKEGINFQSDYTSAPVTNASTIKKILVLPTFKE
jgi:hypothetical protein